MDAWNHSVQVQAALPAVGRCHKARPKPGEIPEEWAGTERRQSGIEPRAVCRCSSSSGFLLFPSLTAPQQLLEPHSVLVESVPGDPSHTCPSPLLFSAVGRQVLRRADLSKQHFVLSSLETDKNLCVTSASGTGQMGRMTAHCYTQHPAIIGVLIQLHSPSKPASRYDWPSSQ